MPAKMPWMKFYPSDWTRDLRRVPLDARGLWLDLVCEMWNSPDRGVLLHANGHRVEDEEIPRIVGETPATTRRALAQLERVGILSRDDAGAIVCRRMLREEAVRNQTRKRVQKHRSSAGGNAPCNAPCNGSVTGQKSEVRSQKSEDRKDPPIPPRGGTYPEAFERFWKAYPRGRKTGKGNAAKAWAKATKIAPAEKIIEAAIDYAQSDAGRGEFVKMPTSWLNGRCWEDDRQAWTDLAPETKPKRDYETLLGGDQ
jgi:hypothetical protein